jgi:hypothetical protein
MVAGDSAPASVHGDNSEMEHDKALGSSGRPRRSAANQGSNGWPESRRSGSDEESEAEFGDDEDDAHVPEESEDEEEFDEEEGMAEDDLEDQPQSLVVKLSITPPKLRTVLSPIDSGPNMLPTPDAQDWKVDAPIPESRTVEMPDAPAPAPPPVPEPQSVPLAQNKRGQTPDLRENTPQTKTSPADVAEKTEKTEPPVSPSAISPTPLAFRGSPEKSHAQLASPSGNLNGI